jgi:hypothetical protein
MGPSFSPAETIGQATVNKDGVNIIPTAGGDFHPVPKGYVRNVAGVVTMTDPYKGEKAYLVSIGDGASGLLLDDHVDYVPNETGGDCADAIAERDATWVAHLTPD